jgi:hypothetical protein
LPVCGAADQAVGLLGSAHDGERAAAGLKVHELLRRHGLTWPDVLLAAAPPTAPPKIGWRDKLAVCAAHRHCLNNRERAFVRSLATWRGTPSPKQLSWLDRIYKNLP